MTCVPPLDKADEDLKFVCLQRATAGSAEERHGVEKKGEDRGDVAAGEWFGAIQL